MSPYDAQQQPQQAPGQNPFSTTPQPVDSGTAAQPKTPKPAWWMVPAAALVGVALGAGATYAFTGSKEEQVSAASVEPASSQSGESNNADTSNAQEDSTTGGTLDELPKLGEPAMSGNEKVIIDSVELAPTVELRTEEFTPGEPDTAMEGPRNEGAQFVIVSGTVSNEGKTPFNADFSLFAWIADQEGRKYAPLDDHWRVQANRDVLNDSVGPGFSTPYTWVFEVPGDFTPVAFAYDDTGDNVIGNRLASIDVRS
ncbi:DUF4352 domain-containing protein [Corynebacterium hesseae]